MLDRDDSNHYYGKYINQYFNGGAYMRNMKNVGKTLATGAVFLAGYFVGFYEMKYKIMKLMLEDKLKKEDKGEESQQ